MRRSAARSAAGKIEELGISRSNPAIHHAAMFRSRRTSHHARPPSTAHAATPSHRRHRDVGIHRESVGHHQQPQIAPDHRALRQQVMPRRDSRLHAGRRAGSHRGGVDHARARRPARAPAWRPGATRFARARPVAAPFQPDQQQRKRRAFLLGQQRRRQTTRPRPRAARRARPQRAEAEQAASTMLRAQT